MRTFLKSPSRFAAVALALGLGAAGLATPAFALGGAGMVRPHVGGGFPHGAGGFPHHGGGEFHGRGGWGPGVGAGVLGEIIGGAILGSAAYPYYDYDYGYGTDPCWKYTDVYGSAGEYLGRQLINTCQ